jgi:hypothetical protein
MPRVVRRKVMSLFCAGVLAACAQSPAVEAVDSPDGSTMDMSPVVVGADIDGGVSVVDRPSDMGPRQDADVGDSSATDAAAEPANPVNDAGSMDAGSGDVPADSDSGAPVPVDSGVLDSAAAAPVVPSCGDGTTLCGDTCVNLTNDAANCGRCTNRCDGAACEASACVKPAAAPAGCSAKTYGGHSYLFCTTQLDWIDARDACRAQRLDMTVINDAAENEFVRSAGGAWIGASDIDGEAKWRALAPGVTSRADGPLVTFTNWAAGQPSNTAYCAGLMAIGNDCLFVDKTDEDCAYMTSDGRWDDLQCPLLRPSVCESY